MSWYFLSFAWCPCDHGSLALCFSRIHKLYSKSHTSWSSASLFPWEVTVLFVKAPASQLSSPHQGSSSWQPPVIRPSSSGIWKVRCCPQSTPTKWTTLTLLSPHVAGEEEENSYRAEATEQRQNSYSFEEWVGDSWISFQTVKEFPTGLHSP